MLKALHLLGLLMAVMLLAVSCSNDKAPTGPVDGALTSQVAMVLPEGAELNSATFYIAVRQTSGQNVNIHRITSTWEEMTVTWNNFGGAYAPEVYGSFTAADTVYYGVDVTALVSGWLSGAFANYGLLLDQNDLYYPWTMYFAREVTWRPPYMDICYSLDGEEICETIYPLADAYIYESMPDSNKGSASVLYSGAYSEGNPIKQSLIMFEIGAEEEPPVVGCTRTIGYWKTHAGFGPQDDMVTPLLPQWLGTAGGDKSLAVTTARISVDVLVQKTYGRPSNGITKLYAQLLGAKLNFASGASSDAVDEIVGDADEFLADHDWTDWRSLNRGDRKKVMEWHRTLDEYNNGLIGPGHCSDGGHRRCRHKK